MRVHNKEKEDIMRIKNLFRNSFFSMFSQFALLILGFFSQRAMNLYMGAELVGMNGVISNVINILSVTELGISTAIVYHLYGALARKDEHEIASLMNLYRKAYRIFAVIVFTAGMLLLLRYVADSYGTFLSAHRSKIALNCGSEGIHCEYRRPDFKCCKLSGDYSSCDISAELSSGTWHWDCDRGDAEHLD